MYVALPCMVCSVRDQPWAEWRRTAMDTCGHESENIATQLPTVSLYAWCMWSPCVTPIQEVASVYMNQTLFVMYQSQPQRRADTLYCVCIAHNQTDNDPTWSFEVH